MLKKIVFISAILGFSAHVDARMITVQVDSLIPQCVENYVEYDSQLKREELPFKCWYEKISISVQSCSSVNACSDEALMFDHNCYTHETTPTTSDVGIRDFFINKCKEGDSAQDALYNDFIRNQEQQEASEESIVAPETNEDLLFQPIP